MVDESGYVNVAELASAEFPFAVEQASCHSLPVTDCCYFRLDVGHGVINRKDRINILTGELI